MPADEIDGPSLPTSREVDATTVRLLAERGRDIIYRYRLVPDRAFEYVSPASTAITGYTPDDYYADPDLGFKLVHPDDATILADPARMAGPDPVVLRWIRRDGTTIWTEQANVPVMDEAGRLVAIEGSARDVTARELARLAVEASEQRLMTILERAELLAGTLDLQGRVSFANAALLGLCGWTADEIVGVDWFAEFVPKPLQRRLRAAFEADIAAGEISRDVESVIVTRDGNERRVALHVMGVTGAAGELAGVAMLGEDLTALDERTAVEDRLTAAVLQAADAVVITDPDANILYVNPAFERISGYRLDEVRGRNPRMLASGRQTRAFYRRMWRTLTSGAPWRGEFVNRRRDGSLFVEEAAITPIFDRSRRISAYVGVKRDVTHLRELRESLDAARRERDETARAIADLTPAETLEATADRIAGTLLAIPGAATGGVIVFENGSGARQVALATDLPISLPLTDGDRLPQSRVDYLRDRATSGPWIETWRARPEDGTYVEAVAQAGISAVLYAPIGNGAAPFGLVAVGGLGPNAVQELAEHLASATEIGAVSRTLLAPFIDARWAIAEARERLSSTIEARAFQTVYQPIAELADRLPVGFEALTRFDSGTRPDLVFADARHAGLGPELELVTLEAALAGAMALPSGPWLSLNVSPALLVDGDRLAKLLARRDRAVLIEVTEHETITDYGALRAAIVRLGADVRIAVDDAGAGAANFNHLVELRPDFVKLDMAFIRNVNADLSRQALVVGMRHFARALGSWVIAEGIETEAELATLRRLDLHYGQGYLLGRPAPAASWATARTAAMPPAPPAFRPPDPSSG